MKSLRICCKKFCKYRSRGKKEKQVVGKNDILFSFMKGTKESYNINCKYESAAHITFKLKQQICMKKFHVICW